MNIFESFFGEFKRSKTFQETLDVESWIEEKDSIACVEASLSLLLLFLFNFHKHFHLRFFFTVFLSFVFFLATKLENQTHNDDRLTNFAVRPKNLMVFYFFLLLFFVPLDSSTEGNEVIPIKYFIVKSGTFRSRN